MTETIRDLLAGRTGPALGQPGRPDLGYPGLLAAIDRVGRQLGTLGVGPGDDVAIVLPNGPEMAAAFLAVGSHAVAAPLNPAYTQAEFAFYMQDLGARLLIVAGETPARAAAEALGIPVATLVSGEAAGDISLDGVAEGEARRNGPDDVALVLHTSGTTSRPKIVPLTSANVVASARNVAATLRLTPQDRCLNIMPLFHIHGLIAAVLSSIGAGAAITCTPGFDALRFFGWLDEVRPTWYTAVPTMHQAILARAPRNAEAVARARLRFVRSSSASLPVPVFRALVDTFRCPVIEAYGMTEAAHQMASNRLDLQKPGTVGPGGGPEVAIMSETDGTLLPPGAVGEIVIRGPNVTRGYRGNPDATARAFTDGWFRTGDQGEMDADGFVSIRGRLKEIINRGGEKVSPREVDDVLMEHPAVAQVVTFAMPHDKLGEDVAAAVVLREGQSVDPAELRDLRGAVAGGLQGAAAGADPRRDPQRRDRQAAAHRAGREAGARVRICVFGAGAIGGLLAVRLANCRAGRLGRRPRPAPRRDPRERPAPAQRRGRGGGARHRHRRPRPTLGPQDYLVITLKAHSVPPVAAGLAPLIGPSTCIVIGHERRPLLVLPRDGGMGGAPGRGGRSRRRRSRPRCRRRRRSAASSIPRPRSTSPVSSATSTATASPWASPTARSPTAPPGCRRRCARPASRRRCGRASATRSGSSSGATSPSTRCRC